MSKVIGARARWLAVLCGVTAMALALGACGGSDKSSSNDTSTAASANCTPKHEFRTIHAGTLTVAAIEYMPYSRVDGSTPTGVDGEMLQAIAKLECLQVNAIAVDAAGAIAQVTSGRTDVAAGDWWRSKERQKIVDVTDPTYLDAMAVLSKDGYSSFRELEGKNVGDLQGNVWNREAKDVLGDSYHLYQSVDQALQDLDSGRLEAVIVTAGQIAYEQKQGKYPDYKLELMRPDPRVSPTTRQPQATIPHTKGNTALGTALSEDIAELKANGTLKRIVERYGLPDSVLDTGDPYLV